MLPIDTFWTFYNGILIEVYKENNKNFYKAVNPTICNKPIFRTENQIFEKRPVF